MSSQGHIISNVVSKISSFKLNLKISHEPPNSCILKLFSNWERVNKNIYLESNFNFVFLQELVKKMKTLILKVLLCPDL